jgi:hypothetical protein
MSDKRRGDREKKMDKAAINFLKNASKEDGKDFNRMAEAMRKKPKPGKVDPNKPENPNKPKKPKKPKIPRDPKKPNKPKKPRKPRLTPKDKK